ncbi:heme ABC exporter ATP-binding protein CcmA [Halobacteriaceae archaeon GCM10025711]
MTTAAHPDSTDEHAQPVASVDAVGKSFGDLTVLDDVSFDLPAGTITALIGPNGSGKTTLLRIVAGLLRPTTGRVDLAVDAERTVGYLPQQPAFRPRFSVAETLSFYANLVNDGDLAARLEQVGLRDVHDRRVGALSGGMTRLLALAQTTIGDPPVVVLDEPTSGLDPEMTEHIFEVIDDLADAGVAVLLATHDLAAVETVTDRVVLLDDGHIVARGSPADLASETGTDSLGAAFSALVRKDGGLTVRTGRRGDDA